MHTEAAIQEARDFLADIDIILTSLKDIEGKVNSENGKVVMSNLLEEVTPAFKELKAQTLIEFDLI